MSKLTNSVICQHKWSNKMFNNDIKSGIVWKCQLENLNGRTDLQNDVIVIKKKNSSKF